MHSHSCTPTQIVNGYTPFCTDIILYAGAPEVYNILIKLPDRYIQVNEKSYVLKIGNIGMVYYIKRKEGWCGTKCMHGA